MTKKTVALLIDLHTALNDWLHLYAPEFCDEVDINASRTRIRRSGGTVSYIAKLSERLQKELNEHS
jgi:hypothetical protein